MSARVLIVEDNESSLVMLTRRLRIKGFEVLSAEDGGSAFELACRELPDIILLDLSLPVMDGWTVARALRSHTPTKDLRIIALTAHAMAAHRSSALAAGCDDFATKPVDFALLLQQMDALLHRTNDRLHP